MTYVRQTFSLGLLAAIGFALFVLLFWLGAASGISILFYRGLLLAVAAAIATGVLARWIARDDESLPIAAAAVSLSLNICFLVLLPVTVDRSVTVYLLTTIERQQAAGLDEAALRGQFVSGYVDTMHAIPRRIDEQVKSGNIRVAADGTIHLTDQGERFMRFSRLVASVFKTDPRFVGQRTAATPKRKSREG